MFLGSGEDAGKLLAFGASCFRTLKKYIYIYIYTDLRLGVFRVGRRCREAFGIWSILLQDVKKVYIYIYIQFWDWVFLGSGEDAGKLLAFGASCFRTLKSIFIYSFETGCF